MSTQKTTGTGAPGAATPQKNEKGLAVVTPAKTVNPFEERKLKVSAIQRKLMDVQRLKELQNELSEYQMGMDENGSQRLEIRDNQRRSFETSNPKLIGDVIAFISKQCENRIPQLETEVMTATI